MFLRIKDVGNCSFSLAKIVHAIFPVSLIQAAPHRVTGPTYPDANMHRCFARSSVKIIHLSLHLTSASIITCQASLISAPWRSPALCNYRNVHIKIYFVNCIISFRSAIGNAIFGNVTLEHLCTHQMSCDIEQDSTPSPLQGATAFLIGNPQNVSKVPP